METIASLNQLELLIRELSIQPTIKETSNIVSLTSNELADIALKISSSINKETSLDKLLGNTVALLGNVGIAERVLLFQIDNNGGKALLAHYWESQYTAKFNPVGFHFNLGDLPLSKFFNLTEGHTVQIEDFTKYLVLPSHLFKSNFKALFLKLKTKSLLVSTGSTDRVKLALNLQFCTREVIWSNEIEKVLQSIINQLAYAIEKLQDKKNKENLQNNFLILKETTDKKYEELYRKFAGDLHDLPCSIIPNLKRAIKEKDLNECDRLTDELHKNLRTLINEYSIPDINLLGFVSTTYQILNGFKKVFNGEVIIDFPNEEIDINHNKALETIKVIKEWLCNIEKHSCAKQVHFSLNKLNEYYILVHISDNGKGFDITSKNQGFGISNIKGRLSAMNSKFEIKSEIDKGSSLKFQLCVN